VKKGGVKAWACIQDPITADNQRLTMRKETETEEKKRWLKKKGRSVQAGRPIGSVSKNLNAGRALRTKGP